MNELVQSVNPAIIRTEWSTLNTEEGDGLPCTICGKEIVTWVEERRGRCWIDRSNRIDCEEDGVTFVYHLECYDLEVFGEVTKVTKDEMNDWNARYE